MPPLELHVDLRPRGVDPVPQPDETVVARTTNTITASTTIATMMMTATTSGLPLPESAETARSQCTGATAPKSVTQARHSLRRSRPGAASCSGARGAREHGQAVAVARADGRVVGERAAVGARDHTARLLHDERRRGDVVGEVGAHRAVADDAERRLELGQLVDEPPSEVDVRVELAGDDARHVERRGAEIEEAAVHRRPSMSSSSTNDDRARPAGRAARRSRTARADRRCRSSADRHRRSVGRLACAPSPRAAKNGRRA